jgi:hypothetical protein
MTVTDSYTFLERIALVAPLGLHFVDVSTGATDIDSLSVSAAPVGDPNRALAATRTPHGSYAFARLPGLDKARFGAGDAGYWAKLPAPAARSTFIITVTDSSSRFLPFKFEVKAPWQGYFALKCAPSDDPIPLIPLFSVPQRPPVPGFAIVRAELHTTGGQPAAFARLEVLIGSTIIGRAVADSQGRAVAFFPYPKIANGPSKPLLTREWTVDLRTFHDLDPPPVGLPALCAILKQPQVTLLAAQSAKLRFGQELFVE